jgi:hypothetical protein
VQDRPRCSVKRQPADCMRPKSPLQLHMVGLRRLPLAHAGGLRAVVAAVSTAGTVYRRSITPTNIPVEQWRSRNPPPAATPVGTPGASRETRGFVDPSRGGVPLSEGVDSYPGLLPVTGPGVPGKCRSLTSCVVGSRKPCRAATDGASTLGHARIHLGRARARVASPSLAHGSGTPHAPRPPFGYCFGRKDLGNLQWARAVPACFQNRHPGYVPVTWRCHAIPSRRLADAREEHHPAERCSAKEVTQGRSSVRLRRAHCSARTVSRCSCRSRTGRSGAGPHPVYGR